MKEEAQKIKVSFIPIPAGLDADNKLIVNVFVGFRKNIDLTKEDPDYTQGLIYLNELEKPETFPGWIPKILNRLEIIAQSTNGTRATFNPAFNTYPNTLWLGLFGNLPDPPGPDWVPPASPAETLVRYEQLLTEFQNKLKKDDRIENLIKQLKDKKVKNEIDQLNKQTEQDPARYSEAIKDLNRFKERIERYEKLKLTNGDREKYKCEISEISKRIPDTEQQINRKKGLADNRHILPSTKDTSSTKYTSDFNNFRPVTFNDIIGYLTNYPILMEQAGLLYRFTCSLPNDSFTKTAGCVSIAWKNSVDSFSLHPDFIVDDKSFYPVAYQFCPYQTESDKTTKYWFMPGDLAVCPTPTPSQASSGEPTTKPTDADTPANPSPTSAAQISSDKFIGGFLNLNRLRNGARIYELQQTYGVSPIDKKPSESHTKGLLLTIKPDDKDKENKDTIEAARQRTSNALLTIQDLVIGYRVDVRRQIKGMNKPGNWRSLHFRLGQITLNSNAFKELKDEEGWISPETLTENKQLVLFSFTNNSEPVSSLVELQEIWRKNKEDKTFKITIPCPQSSCSPIEVQLNEGGDMSLVQEGDKLTMILPPLESYKQDSVKSAKDLIDLANKTKLLVDDLNKKLTDKISEILRIRVHQYQLGCNQNLELYFDKLVNPDGITTDPATTFIPSTLFCQIGGQSLSAVTPINPNLPSINKKFAEGKFAKDNSAKLRDHDPKENYASLFNFLSWKELKIGTLLPKPGTLPVIRIGDTYEVRCRAVMLDGSSLPVDVETLKSEENYTLKLKDNEFKRLETVSAPAMLFVENPYQDVARKQHKNEYQGASEYQIVIRDNEDLTKSSHNKRLIVPPAITWQLAEWLKLMDNEKHLPDPGKMVMYTGLMPKYTPVGANYKWEDGTGRIPAYTSAAFQAFIKKPDLRYIADPFACYLRITLTERNHMEKGKYRDGSYAPWPVSSITGDTSTYKIQLVDKTLKLFDGNVQKPWELTVWPHTKGKGFVEIQSTSNSLIIRIQEGADLELRMQFFFYEKVDSYPNKLDPPADFQNANRYAERRFRLIYATQKPMIFPQFLTEKEEVLDKKPEPTQGDLLKILAGPDLKQSLFQRLRVAHPEFERYVFLPFWVRFNGYAADSFELYAKWYDYEDKVGIPFLMVDYVEAKIELDDTLKFEKELPHYIEANKRDIKESLSPIPHQELAFNFLADKEISKVLLPDRYAEGSDEPMKLDEDTAVERTVYRTIYAQPTAQHVLPDTKCHLITYWLGSKNRFRHFYPAKADTLTFSKSLTLLIPSSRSPAPPKIARVQLIFDWEYGVVTRNQGKIGNVVSQTVTRKAQTLRVLLERPWYSSGLGEKLAILLAPNSPELGAQSLYSAWGRDITTWDNPALETPNKNSFLRKENLKGFIKERKGLTIHDSRFKTRPATACLQKPSASSIGNFDRDDKLFSVELTGQSDIKPCFDIVYYDVKPYDEDKRLVCVDIEFNSLGTSYAPFVRLALACYQPHSIKDEELSGAVVCDFMQIWPDRTLTYTPENRKLTITVTASSIKKGANKKPRAHFYATLLEKKYDFLQKDPKNPEDGPSKYTKSVNFYHKDLIQDKTVFILDNKGGGEFSNDKISYDPVRDINKRLTVWEFESFDNKPTDKELENPFQCSKLRLVYGAIVYDVPKSPK